MHARAVLAYFSGGKSAKIDSKTAKFTLKLTYDTINVRILRFIPMLSVSPALHLHLRIILHISTEFGAEYCYFGFFSY